MYVTQDENKQLTVVNPAVALRVALLQGIYGLFYFLLRINTQTHTASRLPFVTCVRFGFTFPFLSLSSFSCGPPVTSSQVALPLTQLSQALTTCD